VSEPSTKEPLLAHLRSSAGVKQDEVQGAALATTPRTAHLSAVFGNDWFALKAEVSNPVCLSGAQKRFC